MTFRRVMLFILVFALLLGCAALPAGAEHTHKWVDVDYEVQPTCTKPGSKVQICSCGESRLVDVPALGHEFSQQVYTGYADCTHYGSFYWVCERCGAHSAIGNDKPLGHDWDEGVITTPPQGFTPGVKTYTCKRDPSHTYTEEVEPIEWVFATLENGIEFPDLVNGSTVDLKDIPPLVIVKQPEGGSITRYEDETHTMHVVASGGTGDYTYEWHSHAQELGQDEKYNASLKWLLGFIGITPEQVDEALQESYSDTDTLVAYNGGQDYYCVVTDSVGNKAKSDYAHVAYKVRISKEPENVNAQVNYSVTLSCEAADGSGSYSYVWYNSDDEEVGIGNPLYLPVTVGYFYCVVTDEVTGDTATSEMCTAYSTTPFRLVDITEDFEALPDEDAYVIASFAGGVEDYEIWWKKDGTAISSVEGYDENGHYCSRANVDGAGIYTVYAVDSMYATINASVTVTVPKLTIAAQPKGGIIPKDGYASVSVAVADGKAPYLYTLMQSGKEIVNITDDDMTCSFNVWDAGSYYIHIVDSKGRYIDSDTVYFEDAVFRIKNQTESAELKYATFDSEWLSVEAEGGKEPYSYMWLYTKDGKTYKVGNDSAYYCATMPGEYCCAITDDDGDKIYSKYIEVSYTGEAPFIMEQPKSCLDATAMSDGSVSGITLTCKAISGTGDDRNLIYVWLEGFNSAAGWAQMKDEYRGKTINAPHIGTYRCYVIDTQSGKSTYSEVAVVAEKLQCTKTEVKREYNPYDPNGKYWGVDMSFSGGTGPYTIQIFAIYYRYSSQRTGVLYSETVVDDIRNYHRMLPMYHEYVDTSESPASIKGEEAQYYMIVKDAGGQILHENILMD